MVSVICLSNWTRVSFCIRYSIGVASLVTVAWTFAVYIAITVDWSRIIDYLACKTIP